MGREHRLRTIDQWLKQRRCVRPQELERELEVSRATIKRDIQYLRERLDAPVRWCTERGGWTLDHQPGPPLAGQQQFELPGLWFNAEEIHALLTMQHLLASLDAGGLLRDHIEPLRKRLARILGSGAPPKADVARRIRVQTVGARRITLPCFQAVGGALLQRRRAVIRYQGRSRADTTEREVSPQRLVHYRDNWYLDAWCHWRHALRSFAVDAIESVDVLDRPAIDVPDTELDEVLGAGYGIFAGHQVQWAILRFGAQRARWVAAERWHSLQRGNWDAQGRWTLTLPYSDPRELVMDILRHVPDVEVIAPEELRDEVLRRLRAGLQGMGLDE